MVLLTLELRRQGQGQGGREGGREVGVWSAGYLLTRRNLGEHSISINISLSIEYLNGRQLIKNGIAYLVHRQSKLSLSELAS